MQESELSPYSKEYIPLKNRKKCIWCLRDYIKDEIIEDSICMICFATFPALEDLLIKVTYVDVGHEHDGYCSDQYDGITYSLYYYDIIEVPKDFKYHMITKDSKFCKNYLKSIKEKYESYNIKDYDKNLIKNNGCHCAYGVCRNIIKAKIVKREVYKNKLNTTTRIKYRKVTHAKFDNTVVDKISTPEEVYELDF